MNETQVIYRKYICRRCGNCCRWPGLVKLTAADTARLAAFLRLTVEELVAEYAELHPRRTGLVLKSRANGECCFLAGVNRCRVNPVKPAQCDGFPNRWQFPGWREVCAAVTE
ncbi:MAG: YkgJ family cysteine cluster protein [Verrucomicrobiales bacterium]|nr:YkgJ family cysteine cluster protein [Verrucomicrobiales bacterium]